MIKNYDQKKQKTSRCGMPTKHVIAPVIFFLEYTGELRRTP
jgi:hypothetical protein